MSDYAINYLFYDPIPLLYFRRCSPISARSIECELCVHYNTVGSELCLRDETVLLCTYFMSVRN